MHAMLTKDLISTTTAAVTRSVYIILLDIIDHLRRDNIKSFIHQIRLIFVALGAKATQRTPMDCTTKTVLVRSLGPLTHPLSKVLKNNRQDVVVWSQTGK